MIRFASRARPARALLAAALAAGAAVAYAQSSDVLLRGAQFSEEALVNALKPPLPEGTLSRTIRPVGAPPPRPAAPAKPASASLLVTFETNSAELTADARRQLDVVARALANDQLANLSFAIEGHADLRGSPDDNLRLSQARAEAVREYLVSVGRIGPERLAAVGKGDREPLNTREVAAPENRRVTFVTRAQ
jgi:outer membrane protein OmpA-like peptidoglycan-associated protein